MLLSHIEHPPLIPGLWKELLATPLGAHLSVNTLHVFLQCVSGKDQANLVNSIHYTFISHNTGQTMEDSRSTSDTIFLLNLIQLLEVTKKIKQTNKLLPQPKKTSGQQV